ncbi:hypothetical protein EIP86_005859 [Pleurotus ostreatoroseus]|nr:hypothetical protein EIP86_005859 [Pleurotus ostreatoroseus]
MIFKFKRTRPDMHFDVYSLVGLGHLPVSDATALSLHEYPRHICDLQQDLAKEAARRFAENDFENAWLSQSQDKRREVVMEGIYRTMCIPAMETRRKFCPDSTLSHLTSKQGRTYIDMLRTVLPSNIGANSTEPLHFPHPIVDRVLSLTAENERKPGAIAMYRMSCLFRTYCLTAIIWNILLAFVSSLPSGNMDTLTVDIASMAYVKRMRS